MKNKKWDYRIRIRRNNYDKSFKRGIGYYSVSCDKQFGDYHGSSSPCDTEKEVIESIQSFVNEHKNEKIVKGVPSSFASRPMTMKNTLFENNSGLKDVSLGMFFGQNINNFG